MNPVVAVVVTYNRKDILATRRQRLSTEEGAVSAILVIGKGRTDGTVGIAGER